MRAGSVFKRCGKCAARVTERRCPKCGSEAWSWFFVVDIAPKGSPREQRGKGGFPTKAAAIAAMNQLQTEKAAGTYVEPTRTTLGAYLEQWVAAGAGDNLRPWTRRGYEVVVRVHVIPKLGSRPLQALTTPELKAFYAELRRTGNSKGARAGAGLSEKSVHNVHVCLRAALNDAVRDGLLRANPAAGALGKPRSSPEMSTWTREELQAFLSSCVEHQDRNLALFHVAAHTGLRRGELLGLRWRDVKWDLASLAIQRQLGLSEVDGAPGMVDTKSAAGRRAIGLDDDTLEVLRQHREAQAFERRRWGDSYQDHDLVFCRPDGSAHDPDVVTRQFERAAERAGVPRIRLHDLRHTFATLLLEAGVDIAVVSQLLGHSDVGFTGATYAHVTARLKQHAAARFRDYLKDASVAAPIRAESQR